MRKISDVTPLEWCKFNIWIDQMRITHELLYKQILLDFLESGYSIDKFIRNPIYCIENAI